MGRHQSLERPVIIAVLSLLLLFVAPPVTASATDCQPGKPEPGTETTKYFRGNPLLGPADAEMPTDGPVGRLLKGYKRFGGMTYEDWKEDYFPPGKVKPDDYEWPPKPKNEDGFNEKDHTNTPDKKAEILHPGTQLDRFGGLGGKFLGPRGVPFSVRAIPPRNLNTPPQGKGPLGVVPQSDYRVYCVAKQFPVDAGPAAPWFGQRGLGKQYVLNIQLWENDEALNKALGKKACKDPALTGAEGAQLAKNGKQLSVGWLVCHGYLVEEQP